MPKLSSKAFVALVTTSLALIAGVNVPAVAQDSATRQSMEKCVVTVLQRLARSRAAESQVGPAVVSQCDRQLRATLAAAIRTGEAAFCTVETCIDLARARATEEATQLYRQHATR